MSARRLTKADRQRRRRRILRTAGLLLLAVALGAAWLWQRTLPLERVEIVGASHAPVDEVTDLLQVETDSTALFSLLPALLEDRAERHPWVRAAHTRRLPTGTLRVRVEERTPVVLVLDGAGRPAHFLDAEGYAMPVSTGALYDVPVLTGAPDYHPVQPVESASLRSLLAALARADAPTHALVSEIDWRRGELWTTPTSSHGSTRVRIGRSGHTDQLRRLRAFWDQAALPHPEVSFDVVDLRFAGQVVTREAGADDLPSAGEALGDTLRTPSDTLAVASGTTALGTLLTIPSLP